MSSYQLSINNYQLPEGYKQTEVGVIPEDWDVKVIGDIADVKTGPFGSALHESDYVTDGTPIITVEHLGNLGVEHFNLPMVSDEDRSRLKAYSLKAGDIVFSRVGSIDRNALIRNFEDGWLFSGRLLRVRINSLKDYPHYLTYHFHSEPFKQRVREVAVGQTMPSLNTKLLQGVQVVLPTSEEQRAIATALSDVDALIAALDKLIAKKRHLKTATMQQLLTGKKRLPDFGEGKRYKQTEVGMIPEDWKLTTIGDIASVSSGGTPSRTNPSYWGGSIPWITTAQIDFNAVTDAEQFITQDGLKASAAKLFPPNTLLMAMYGQGKTRGKVAILGIEASTNQACAAILLNENVEHDYIFHYLMSQYEEIRDLSNTGNQENLNGLIIKSIEIVLPLKEEQREIATVLSDMDAEISALEARRAKTQAIKQGMMQELLTGRTRLV